MEGVEPQPQQPLEAEPRTNSVTRTSSAETLPPAVAMECGPALLEEGEAELAVEKGESLQSEQEPEEGAGTRLFLDEASNQSRGDGSSSGFLGSPGEPDSRSVSMEVSLDSQSVSMEMGLVPVDRSRSNSLLTETDDSLPFDPSKSDVEKAKRRGSPGRSRVKQVTVSTRPQPCLCLAVL